MKQIVEDYTEENTINIRDKIRQNQAIGFINDEWKRNRSFSTASNWLKQGAKVARKEWKEMETYIYYDEKTGKTIYTNGLTETEWIPTSSDILENDTYSNWVPSINDLLSEDWEILEL